MGSKNEFGLTPLQQRFVQEYTKDFQGTAAAIRAGYSSTCAPQVASRLLGDPRVKMQIEAAQARHRRRCNVTEDMILEELARIALADLRDVVSISSDELQIKNDADGHVMQAVEIAPAARGGVRRSVKLHDKIKALELLARHFGMLNDKLSVNGEVSIPGLLAALKEREKQKE